MITREVLSEDMAGKCGRARLKYFSPVDLDSTATLATWYMELPQAHLFWTKYCLALIHLRDIEGVRPAIKAFPEATHEIMLYVLNPEFNPKFEDEHVWKFLFPVNVVEQFTVNTDEQAIELCQMAARALVDGLLPPEPCGIDGARAWWKKVITETAEHYTVGHKKRGDYN